MVVLAEVLFVFPLNVSDLGLTESEYELVLKNQFVSDVLVPQLPVSVILQYFP